MLAGLVITGQALYNENLQKKLNDKLEAKDTSLVAPDDLKKLNEWLASGTSIELHRAKRMINALPEQSEEEQEDAEKSKEEKTDINEEVTEVEKDVTPQITNGANLPEIIESSETDNSLVSTSSTPNNILNNVNPDMNSKLLVGILQATMAVKQAVENQENPTIELPEQVKLPTMESNIIEADIVEDTPLMLPAPKSISSSEHNEVTTISDTLRDISIGLDADRKDEMREDETEDNRWDDLQQGIDDLLPAIRGIDAGGSSGGLLDDLLDFGGDDKKGKKRKGRGGKLGRVLGGAKNMLGGARGLAVRGGSMLRGGASSLMSGAGALAMANPITAGLLGVAAVGAGGYMAYDHFRGSEESKAVFDKLEDDGVIDHDIIGDSEILNWEAIEGLEPQKLKDLIDYDDFSEEDTKKMQGILDEKNGKGKTGDKKSTVEKEEPKPKADYSKVDKVKSDKGVLSNLHKVTPMGAIYEAMRGDDESKQVFDKLVEDNIIDHDWLGSSEILDWKSIETLKPDMLKNLIKYDDFSGEDLDKMNKILLDKANKGDKGSSKVNPLSKVKKGSKGAGNEAKADKKGSSIEDVANSYTQSKTALKEFEKANPFTDENSKTVYDDLSMEDIKIYKDEELNKQRSKLSKDVSDKKKTYIEQREAKLLKEDGQFTNRFGVPMTEEQVKKFDEENQDKGFKDKISSAHNFLDEQAIKYKEPETVKEQVKSKQSEATAEQVKPDKTTTISWKGKDVVVSQEQQSMLEELQANGEGQKVSGLMNALSEQQHSTKKGVDKTPTNVMSDGNTKLDIPTKEKPKGNGPTVTGSDSESPMSSNDTSKGSSEPTVISSPNTIINNVYNTANEFLGSTSIAKKWGL